MAEFEFQRDEDGRITREQVVFQALGAASASWRDGAFDAEFANDLGEALLEAIDNTTLYVALEGRLFAYIENLDSIAKQLQEVVDMVNQYGNANDVNNMDEVKRGIALYQTIAEDLRKVQAGEELQSFIVGGTISVDTESGQVVDTDITLSETQPEKPED